MTALARELTADYERVRETKDSALHDAFVQRLLSSDEPDVVQAHYELLRDQRNDVLYRLVRSAFGKRGRVAARFLDGLVLREKAPAMRADILLLLGVVNQPSALVLAREVLEDGAWELRQRGCSVLGWMGQPEDVALLAARLLTDSNETVRGTAATALRQLGRRMLVASRGDLLTALRDSLEKETADSVAARVVLTAQSMINKRFGLVEEIEQATISGDVQSARTKCLRALKRATR